MKDLKISKELIEEVMKDKGTFETININKNELSTFGVLGHHIFSINIYEFTFKCKEWAKNKEYIVHSSPTQKIDLNLSKLTQGLYVARVSSNGKQSTLKLIKN